MFERRAEFGHAKHHIDRAFRRVGDNRHLARAVRDSWANLLITSGDYETSKQVLAEAGRRAKVDAGVRPHWDAITESFSLSRLCQAEGRWADAAEELSKALQNAERYEDSGWRRRILINRSKCKALAGDQQGALEDFMSLEISALSRRPSQSTMPRGQPWN